MAKPTLLIVWGYGWAASSPLAYTLQRSNKYCHGGYTKGFYYPSLTVNPNRVSNIESYKDLILTNTWENYKSNGGHRMNLPQDLEPLRDYPLEVFAEFSEKPYTLEKYINYYYTLWETVKPHGFKAVADFSGFSWRQQSLDEIQNIDWSTLHEYFNLKGIFITRDPIRRAFSEVLARNQKYTKGSGDYTDLKDIINAAKDYVEFFDIAKSKIPDTQMFSMEELWEGTGKELKRLSTFLDYPITELWTNLYAPDIGHHLRYDIRVPCQHHGQADAELTPEMYKQYLKDFSPIYNRYRKRFGILPRYWGRPINYNNNL